MSVKFHDDLSELHWRARGAAKCCGASPNGYIGSHCTRESGHTGNHVAHDYSDRRSSAISTGGVQLVWGDKNPHSHLDGLDALAAPAAERCRARRDSFWICTRRSGHGGDHLAHGHRGVCFYDGRMVWWPNTAYLSVDQIRELAKPGGFEAVVGPALVRAQRAQAERAHELAMRRANGVPSPPVTKPTPEPVPSALGYAYQFLCGLAPTMTDFSVADQREALSLMRVITKPIIGRDNMRAIAGRAARFVSMVGMTKQPPGVIKLAIKVLGRLRQSWAGDDDLGFE